jgi:hypothetical protein
MFLQKKYQSSEPCTVKAVPGTRSVSVLLANCSVTVFPARRRAAALSLPALRAAFLISSYVMGAGPLRALFDASDLDGAAATGKGAGAGAGAGATTAGAEDSAAFWGCIAQPAANTEIAAARAQADEGDVNFTDELLVTEFRLLTHLHSGLARSTSMRMRRQVPPLLRDV